MILAIEIILLIISYFLGSIPNALIVSKISRHIDIRNFGSKNMGATNVFRVIGPLWAFLVFILDALKATIIILLFKIGVLDSGTFTTINPLFYGIAAIIGHLYPIYANFKGGKGVACTAGIILVAAPHLFLVTVATFAVVFLISRLISVSSLSAIFTTFVTSLILYLSQVITDYGIVAFLAFASLATIYTHRDNISRLLKGQEKKLHHQKDLIKKEKT